MNEPLQPGLPERQFPHPLQHRIFFAPNGLLRPIWRVVFFIIVAPVVTFAGLYGLKALVAVVPAFGTEAFHIGSTISRLVFNTVLLLVTALFTRVFDRRGYHTLGLWFYPGWAKEAALGVLCGAGVIAAVIGGMVAARGAVYHGWGEAIHLWGQFGGTAVYVLLAAASEEIVFRGYAFQRLLDSIGRLGAILVLSALFGAAHLNNPGQPTAISAANTALAGVLLAVAYLKTRGLWLPLGLHWAWNFFLGPVFGLPVSGFTLTFQPYLFNAEVSGPAWLTGANYGPEGSILLTGVCVVAIVWLWRSRRISPSPAMAEVLK